MAGELERAVAFMRALEDRAAARTVPFPGGAACLDDRLPRVHDLDWPRLLYRRLGFEEVGRRVRFGKEG